MFDILDDNWRLNERTQISGFEERKVPWVAWTVASSETDIFGRRDSFGRKFYFNCGPKISHSPDYYPLGLQRGYSCGKEGGEFNSCFFWAFLRGEWVGGREIGKLSLPSVFPSSSISYSILGCSSLIIIRLFKGFSIKLTLNGGVFSGKMTGSFSSFGTIYVYVHHVSHVIRLGLGTILLEKWFWIILWADFEFLSSLDSSLCRTTKEGKGALWYLN